jgi:hypothetical protein
MYWNRRFAIVVSLIWAVLVAGGFYLLAGLPAQHHQPAAQTDNSHRNGSMPVAY